MLHNASKLYLIDDINLDSTKKFTLNFNHPTHQIDWENMGKMTEHQKKMQQHRTEQYDVQRKMNKMLRQVSTARKLYRKHKCPEHLQNLQNKELLYSQLYNMYWYDYVYNK
jgi:ribosome-binding ATPase YchF (GTP1/OBG family)